MGLKTCLFFWRTVRGQFCFEVPIPMKNDSASYFWSMWLTCDPFISSQMLAEHNKQFDDFWFSFYLLALKCRKMGLNESHHVHFHEVWSLSFCPGFCFLCENTPFKALLMLRGTDFYAAQGSQVSQTFASKSKVKRKCHLVPSAFRISRM